jgi:NhaA family Na+:H+ antiporter
LWALTLKAGLHPAITGFLAALFIPGNKQRGEQQAPLYQLEKMLNPWVAFIIMPLFALANAGLSLAHISLDTFTHTIVLGIVAGLFIGKQLGVFGVSWCFLKISGIRLPGAMNLQAVYGVSLLCGIGFTMSLFLGTLSFQGQSQYIEEVRLGVITGSILSGLAGASVLALVLNREKSARKK